MVDEAKNKQKGKSVEIMEQSENDESRQMDIWENNVSMVLLIGGHLEAKLDNTTNVKMAKKQVMKYHWSEYTMFFQNLVVPRLAKWRMLIEKIHKEIGHFGEMRTFIEVKNRLFGMTELSLLRNSSKLVKNVS
jgi:hypothetical protein